MKRPLPLLPPLALLPLLLFSPPAFAFQCPPGQTEATLFQQAESVVFARVIRTELDKLSGPDGEVEIIRATYRQHQTLKGRPPVEGQVFEVPGYGSGMVGLVPGIYYVFYLAPLREASGMSWVNTCNIGLNTLNPNAKQVREQLQKLLPSENPGGQAAGQP